MDRELIKTAEQFHIRRRQRSAWKKLVSVLGCIVVFCTTYALILPAITMERETICGFREHQHSDSCYTQQVVKQMVCSGKNIGVHTHSAECGSSCGYADFMIHEHTAACYDDSGALVCTLPQVKEHTHSSGCYRIPQIVVGQHTHTDACYSMQQAGLLCALAESDGHTHTEGCMSQISNLVCALEESEEHAHSATCYSTEAVLSCEKEEIQAHHHAEDCYRWENKLSCGKEEGPVYGPGEPELSCTQKEVKAHTHTAQCFDSDGNWICGQLQILRHVHTQSSFDTSQTKSVLTCNLEEHTHTQACFAEATETTEETTEATEETTEATEETTEATEETTEATEETTEATEEEQTMPTQSFQGLTESNVVVLADADAGAFPAGTTMYASDVSAATARNLAEETADEDTEILDAVGVNITFRDAEGTIIEPENGALVRVSIALPEEKKLEGDHFSLLHRHNDGTVETVENAEVTSDGAGFTTESFSVYIVTAFGNKDKNDVHASLNSSNPLYHNGPYNDPWDTNRPYILHIGDSVEIEFDCPNTEQNSGLYVYYVNRTRTTSTTDNGTETWHYDITGYTDGVDSELSLTPPDPEASPIDSTKNRVRATVTGNSTHDNEDYSLYVITLGPLANKSTGDIPDTQERLFVRVVNGVYVEDISVGVDNFRNYYDHADLEIDNTGHFRGERTAYYPDGFQTEYIIYKANVQRVKKCELLDASDNNLMVQYCSKRPQKVEWHTTCDHGPDAYLSTAENYIELDHIESSRYADNNDSPTQYEFTSKYGHQRFPANVAGAKFAFDLVLIPDKIIFKDYERDATDTEKKEGMMTIESKVVELGKTSVVDAYNYCPDHSGLDFHVGDSAVMSGGVSVSPAFVVLSAKKVLTGRDLQAGEFTFVLKNDQGKVLQTVTNDAKGQIVFDGITYTSAGTHNYTIQEVVPEPGKPGKPGVIYDDTEPVEVVVRISDDGNGKLTAKAFYNGDEYWGKDSQFEFKNEYVEGNLTIQKNVDGKAVDSTESYSLTIRRMDGASINWDELTVEKVKIDSNEKETIQIYGKQYQTSFDISGKERITIYGLPIGQYSIQEWRTPVTPEYTWEEKEPDKGNQDDHLPSNPRDPNGPDSFEYSAGVVTLTKDAPNATQVITNTFTQLAVTKMVEGNTAPPDSTQYTVKVISVDGGSVEWNKIQASSSIPNKTVPLTVNNGVSFTLVKDETVTLAGLPAGKYRVEETTLDGVASVTYSPDGGVITTNAEHYQDAAVVIKNTFPTGYELPATGGPGTGRYTLGGFAMAAGAVLWLCYRRKRRREGG